MIKHPTLKFFEKKIFEQYGQSEQFEKCRKYLLNVLETMSSQISWFNDLSNQKKYEICEISSLIAIHSERESINLFSILKDSQNLKTEHGINRENSKFDIKQIEVNQKILLHN